MEEYKITLMNGRELPCVLKPTQPKKIDKENLKLDDSGQYLSIKKKVEKNDPSFEKEVTRISTLSIYRKCEIAVGACGRNN